MAIFVLSVSSEEHVTDVKVGVRDMLNCPLLELYERFDSPDAGIPTPARARSCVKYKAASTAAL